MVHGLGNIEYRDNHSDGCKSCQAGQWLCIFLTYLCNGNCIFCPSPFRQQDKIVSVFGDHPTVILEYLQSIPVSGISFSGGDCFLVFDRFLDWLKIFKQHHPDCYYWTYTNGISADEEKMNRLAAEGLNEIRFNIAATGYTSDLILKRIETAVSVVEKVAVEIPSIPRDYDKLIAVLPVLDSLGVSYLNLHEFILMPDDPYSRETSAATFTLNKETSINYDPDSVANTERIVQYCDTQNLNLRINNCSLVKKEQQMRQRRLAMGRLFKQPFEQLTADGLLKTRLVYTAELSEPEVHRFLNITPIPDQLRKYFIHPESQCDADRIDELVFLPPLGIDDTRRLYQINKIK